MMNVKTFYHGQQTRNWFNMMNVKTFYHGQQTRNWFNMMNVRHFITVSKRVIGLI